jgi:hypothetical protein
MTDWLRNAACINHPVLEPDAWSELELGHPQGDGAKAFVVCVVACPVRKQCGEHITAGTNIIAGGGWFTRRGTFQGPPEPGMLDVHGVAAYTGLSLGRVQRLMGSQHLPIATRYQGRNWFTVASAKHLSRLEGPPHGSMFMLSLHQIRGEEPCAQCTEVRNFVTVA